MRLWIPFLCSLFLSLASLAETKEKIIWYKPNWPPYYMPTGSQVGEGHIDKLLDILQKQFPNIQFESSYYPLTSLKEMRERRPNTCNVSHLRTKDREKVAYFTAFYIQPPPQLVFRKSDWKEKLYEAKVVSLAQTLTDTKMHGGFSEERSYGANLDPLIKAKAKSSQIEMIPGASDSTSVLNMISADKIDYSIEYPEVVEYLLKNKLANGNFALTEVEEQREPVVVHIACSKTDWGRKTILQLDAEIGRAHV